MSCMVIASIWMVLEYSSLRISYLEFISTELNTPNSEKSEMFFSAMKESRASGVERRFSRPLLVASSTHSSE